MLEYKIILESRYEIEDIVNEHIRHGWKPIGGISISRYMNGEVENAQAMTRKTKHVEKSPSGEHNLADFVDVNLIEEIAKSSPLIEAVDWITDDNENRLVISRKCRYCGNKLVMFHNEHADDCIYIRAKKLVE